MTINAGTIAGKSTVAKTITLEATGFSQPLDKLRDYLWNIDLTAALTGNQSQGQVSASDSISTSINSTQGVAKNLVNAFINDIKPDLDATSQDIQKKIFQSSVEKPLQTFTDNASQQIQDLYNFDVNKLISVIVSDTQTTEQKVNQAILLFPNEAKNAGIKTSQKIISRELEAGAYNLFPGLYESYKSSGLSYNDGFLTYNKAVGKDNFGFDIYVGKLEDIPTAVLESALNKDTGAVQSWVNSTTNDFKVKGSYSRTLSQSQFAIDLEYKKATDSVSYNLSGSATLFKDYRLTIGTQGELGNGQTLPSGYFQLSIPTPFGNRSSNPETQQNLSPFGFTEEQRTLSEFTNQSFSSLNATQANKGTNAILNSRLSLT